MLDACLICGFSEPTKPQTNNDELVLLPETKPFIKIHCWIVWNEIDEINNFHLFKTTFEGSLNILEEFLGMEHCQ